VKLERRSASSRFTIRFHEDEPRVNARLLQFLERDFNLRLPKFGDGLPLRRRLAMIRQAIRDAWRFGA